MCPMCPLLCECWSNNNKFCFAGWLACNGVMIVSCGIIITFSITMLLGVLRWVSLHLAPPCKRHKSSSNPSLCLPDPSDVFKPKMKLVPLAPSLIHTKVLATVFPWKFRVSRGVCLR